MKEPCHIRIKKGLEMKGMKQSELSNKTGLAKSAISQYISGKYIPKQTPTHLMAKALDVSESWLMGYDVPMTRHTPGHEDIIRLYNQLSPENQQYVLDFMSKNQKLP